MLGSLWSLYAVFGLIAGSLAPLLERIRVELDMSRSAMGAALAAWPFVYLFVSIKAGRVLDRIGLRSGLGIGIISIVASGFLRACAQGSISLWFAVAVFGLGGPFISIGAPKLVAEWFGKPTGAMLALVLADPLRVALGGWRPVLAVFATMGIIVGAVWLWVSRKPSPRQVDLESHLPTSELLKDRTVQLVLVLAFGSFFFSHSMGGWMPDMLQDVGWTERGSSWLAAVGVAFGILSALCIPGRVPEKQRPKALAALYLMVAIAVWALATEISIAHLVAVPLIGVARVTYVPLAMLILMSAPKVSTKTIGAAGGLFFTAGEVGGVSGPWITGVARDAASSFTLAIGMLSGLAIVLSVLAISTGKRRLLSNYVESVSDTGP
jgi:cyanate permease